MVEDLEQQDPQVLGERLRAARVNSGLTQDDVAQKLNIARTSLLAVEKGQRRVRPDELRFIARLYETSINALLRGTAIHVDLLPRFRAQSQTSTDAAQSAAKILNRLAATSVELEERLGHKLKTNYPAEIKLHGGDIRAQAEDVAIEMRQRLSLGLSPIYDIVSLLELEMGIRVFLRPLKDGKISGLIIADEKLGACMLLNENHPRERRAITASHETGHFLTARYTPDVVDLSDQSSSREERFADAFAAAFLMPGALVRRRFYEMRQEAGRFSPRHLILLAHQLNVSEEALARRLERLQLVPDGMWDSLMDRGFSSENVRHVLGDQAPAPASMMPPRLWMLAAEAYRREMFDEGQLAEMLCMDRVEVRTLLDTMETGGMDDLQKVPSK